MNTKYFARVNQHHFRHNRRHSTTFSENVVVTETSYQMLQELSFYDRERAYPPSINITVFIFSRGKKINGVFEVSIFKSNLVFESEGL